MGRKKFHGGIEIVKKKALGLARITEPDNVTYIEPDKVYIPLQQHIGAPSEAIVAVGDKVKRGTMIGKVDGGLGASIHSSVSGQVIGFEEKIDASGDTVECVVIENDKEDTLAYKFGPDEDIDDLSKENIIELVDKAGVTGMGGATFPTHVKINPKEDISTVIINGAECEPLLMADAALMKDDGDKIVLGAKAVLKATGAKHAIVGIENDKQEALKHLTKLFDGVSNVEVVEVESIYPQGASEMLIKSLLDIDIPVGTSARKLGIIMINVATVASVGEAISPGIPLTHRICSVVGDVENPQNIYFPLGTLASEIVKFCGGFRGAPAKIISGGFMMGKSLSEIETPLTKANNGLVVINTDHYRSIKETNCIRCGRCVEVCPMELLPHQLDRYYLEGRFDRIETLQVDACINCGCCTYICPAKRDLAYRITQAKGEAEERAKEGK